MSYLRDSYGQVLVELGSQNPNIFVLTADLKTSTRCDSFAEKYPKRFVQCGIAEQNMMGVASGLAKAGKIPIVNSFAVFNPGRNWDQLRVSVCYSNANVKIVGHHSGFSAQGDGATHQAFEDLAITRVLPNLHILQPNSPKQVGQVIKHAVDYFGPVYIRLGGKYDISEDVDLGDFDVNKANILKTGKDLTVVVSGVLTYFTFQAVVELKSQVDIELISFSSLKPFDQKTLIDSAKKTGKVLTIEDHQITGGLGSIVSEVLSENNPVKVFRHGIYDQFGESGSMQDLLKKYKLDKEGIKEKILQIL